mgnify:CR=1 FL=1
MLSALLRPPAPVKYYGGFFGVPLSAVGGRNWRGRGCWRGGGGGVGVGGVGGLCAFARPRPAGAGGSA